MSDAPFEELYLEIMRRTCKTREALANDVQPTCPHCGKPGYHHIELGPRGKTERGTFDMTPEYKCRSKPKDADNG